MDTRLTLDLSSVVGPPKKFEPILELENYSEDESLINVLDKPSSSEKEKEKKPTEV